MSTSSEFITLCRSQVALLTQSLGAALSVVYLTEELVDGEAAQAKLIPVVAYPESHTVWKRQNSLALSPEAKSSETQRSARHSPQVGRPTHGGGSGCAPAQAQPLRQVEMSSELSKTAESHMWQGSCAGGETSDVSAAQQKGLGFPFAGDSVAVTRKGPANRKLSRVGGGIIPARVVGGILPPTNSHPETPRPNSHSKTAETSSAWVSCPLPNWSTDEAKTNISGYSVLPSTQIVLPLMHEGVLMGLLVTSREDRPWTERECSEIERIAQTLALARLLDQRREWFEQRLNQQQRLQAKQRDLFDNLLHQFRNPLTALRIFGKLLLKRLLPGDANRAVADSIVRESDRLQDLLKQFDRVIDLTAEEIAPQKSLPPATRVPLLPNVERAFPITDVLNPLLESAQAIAGERNLKLQTDISPNLRAVQADAKALREALSNLLDNALKYTPSGGKIYIQAGRERGRFQGIAISDTGPGIPPQDLEHIFERHYRGVQLNSQIAGTGLGLAIAKDLIEQMQGEIQVFSPAQLPVDWVGGPGVTFIVWLPMVEES